MDHDAFPDDRYEATTLEELHAAGAEHRTYTLGSDSSQRLDSYLHNRLKGISRNQVQKLIKLGGVTVNAKPAKPSLSLKEGDVVDVMVPPKPSLDLRPEPIPLDILYEDDDLIVINKDAGIIVHPARKYKSGTMVNALAYHLQGGESAEGEGNSAPPETASEAPPPDTLPPTPHTLTPPPGLSPVGIDDQRPGVVHRLDMNTTGVIVFAKRETTHWLLAKQFEHRTNLKCYLALVHGCPNPPSGAIDQPLGKHPTIREAHAVRNDPTGKPSLTLYRVRRRYRGYSLIECELKSGRTHQIRVHLSWLGFPIVGDQLYGGETVGPPEIRDPPQAAGSRPHLNFARPKAEGQRIEADAAERAAAGEFIMATPALHAALLRLKHPATGETLTFTAPLHRPMLDLIHRLEQHPAPGPTVTDGTHVDLKQAIPPLDEHHAL